MCWLLSCGCSGAASHVGDRMGFSLRWLWSHVSPGNTRPLQCAEAQSPETTETPTRHADPLA